MTSNKAANLIASLDAAMPDQEVIGTVRTILAERAESDVHGPVELAGMLIPADTDLEVMTKVFFKEYGDLGFPTGCRVQVAIGGVIAEKGSGWVAKYCFVTLFFNGADERYTVEFHTDFR